LPVRHTNACLVRELLLVHEDIAVEEGMAWARKARTSV